MTRPLLVNVGEACRCRCGFRNDCIDRRYFRAERLLPRRDRQALLDVRKIRERLRGEWLSIDATIAR